MVLLKRAAFLNGDQGAGGGGERVEYVDISGIRYYPLSGFRLKTRLHHHSKDAPFFVPFGQCCVLL